MQARSLAFIAALTVVVRTLEAETMNDINRAQVSVPRDAPRPSPEHPGNVFLSGEEVRVPAVGDRAPAAWRAGDIDGREVGRGRLTGKFAELGKLPVGWYRIEWLDASGQALARTTAAVLQPLAAPTPQDSPVCVDSATAWFAHDDEPRQERFAHLAALAGINWIRDRMNWGEIEPQRDNFRRRTTYDTSAESAARHQLKTLQVFHATPAWAADKQLDGPHPWKRFPRDLRDIHHFAQRMAERFRGRVQAWEPWNEANIEGFGGHTIDEMCSLQKAAYWGFKQGDPEVVVCWNVYAGPGSRLHTEGVLRNEAWPYFETYNIHNYGRPETYLRQFETALEGACGRPVWMTECGIRLRAETPKPWGELSPEDERHQAEFIARSYASSLFAGVQRHFFFILGNYWENGVQFGVLRHDQTPRPGYVALAAVGRLLAGARPLGRWQPRGEDGPQCYAFRARPDGEERDVLVAWSMTAGQQSLPPAVRVLAAYDFLGRRLEKPAAKWTPSAQFVVLPAGECAKLPLAPPPSPAPRRRGSPSPIVLQVQLPHSTVRLGSQSHALDPGGTRAIPVDVYNFSSAELQGRVRVASAPANCRPQPDEWSLTVPPMGRQRMTMSVALPESGRQFLQGQWMELAGDFGAARQAKLAFRISCPLEKLHPATTKPIPPANRAEAWQDNIVSDGKMSHEPADDQGVLFDMQFGDMDPWAYPRLRLPDESMPDASFDGLALTVQILEGTGSVRVQFIEESGAAYLASTAVDAANRQPQRTVVLFSSSRWGSYSRPDPNHRLDPETIRSLLVGINSKRKSRVRMVVRDLAWVRF